MYMFCKTLATAPVQNEETRKLDFQSPNGTPWKCAETITCLHSFAVMKMRELYKLLENVYFFHTKSGKKIVEQEIKA